MRLADHQERRINPRLEITRPGKIRQGGHSRYDQARTINVSTGGALLEIVSPRQVKIGDQLGVAVAWSDTAVLRATNVLPARVIRSRPIDEHRQEVAVQFVLPEAAPQAASVAA